MTHDLPAVPAPWVPSSTGVVPLAGGSALDRALWNALLSYMDAPLGLGGRVTCSFARAECPPLDRAGVRLRLSSGQDVVAVPVDFPFAAEFEADLAVADLAGLPPPLRDALVEGIVTSVAAAMPLSAPPDVTATGFLAALELDEPWPWFRLTLSGAAAEPILVDLAAAPASLAEVFGGLPMRVRWPGLAARLTRPVDRTLGRLRVALASLRDWEPGAVAVLDATAGGPSLRLNAGDTLYDFDAEHGGWRCSASAARPREERAAMAEGDDARAGRLGLIQVDVDFDLGRANVALSEMEGWQPGSLVALPEALTAAGTLVTLRVNGRAVGTGDLVEVGGRVAVRLSTLAL